MKMIYLLTINDHIQGHSPKRSTPVQNAAVLSLVAYKL